jgi:hypothetical protein
MDTLTKMHKIYLYFCLFFYYRFPQQHASVKQLVERIEEIKKKKTIKEASVIVAQLVKAVAKVESASSMTTVLKFVNCNCNEMQMVVSSFNL